MKEALINFNTLVQKLKTDPECKTVASHYQRDILKKLLAEEFTLTYELYNRTEICISECARIGKTYDEYY